MQGPITSLCDIKPPNSGGMTLQNTGIVHSKSFVSVYPLFDQVKTLPVYITVYITPFSGSGKS